MRRPLFVIYRRSASFETDDGLRRLKLAKHRREELRHRRMDVHGALDYVVGRLGIHYVEDRMDDLVTADAEQGGAQNSPVVGVDQDLHEAFGLALLDGAADARHRP